MTTYTSPYTPIDTFPDLDGTGGAGPLQLTDQDKALVAIDLMRADYNISSISNTTPIVVTTAAAHTFQTGDKVTHVGAAVSAVNATFTVTRISSTTYSLNGSSASGSGGGAGRAFNAKGGVISQLINGINYLGKRYVQSGSSVAKAFFLTQSQTARWDPNAGGQWLTTVTGTESSGASMLMFFQDIPDGVSLSSVTILVNPANTHANLPAVLPKITLVVHDCVAGSSTTFGPQTDGSANLAAYEPAHTITLSFAATEYDRSRHVVVATVQAESGANSISGFQADPAVVHWS